MNLFKRPLQLIGYWSGGYGGASDWPDVSEFVDPSWAEQDRLDVGMYLRNGIVARAWLGYSPCRLCDDKCNGSLDLTDGTYVWPEGLAHYVLDHSVWLPERFSDHVQAQLAFSDELAVDDEWWRRVAPPKSRPNV